MQTQEEINNDALISEGGIPIIQKDDRVKKVGTDTTQETIVKEPTTQENIVTPPVTPVENIEKIETKVVEQPKTQDSTTTSEKTTKPITTIEEFKNAGATTKELTSLLENRAIENIEIQGNKVTGEKNGERFEWTIDKENNPIRKSLGLIGGEKENFAKNADISFNINSQGQTVFNPQNTDEVIDLYLQFGDKVNIKKGSIEAIRGTSIWQKFSKYRGATPDIYFNGLKNGEIAEGGETWNRVLKMNGGIMTPQMAQAKEKYEVYLETNKINRNSAELYKAFGGESEVTVKSSEQDFRDTIEKLDSKYISTKIDIIENIEEMYTTFKEGKEETNTLRKKANETASKMDEIEVAKRKILKDIQENNPKLPLSSQLQLASNRTEDLNDELFALQRQYNIEISDYQYSDTQDQSEFEFNMKMADYKAGFIDSIYGIQRGELIRQEDIARTERQIQEEIERVEEARKQAIIDADELRAKEFTYQQEILKAQADINKSAYQFTTPTAGVIAKMNPTTGEVEFIKVDGEGSIGGTSTQDISYENLERGDISGKDLLFAPEGTKIKGKYQDGLECGEFVNDIVGQAGYMGNLIEDKLARMENVDESKINQSNSNIVDSSIGDVAVWKPSTSNEFSKYGHTGIIIGENYDGTQWIIRSSNLKGDGVISEDYVNKQDIIGSSSEFRGELLGQESAYGVSQIDIGDSISMAQKNPIGKIEGGFENITSRDGTKTIIGTIPGVDLDFERIIKQQLPATLLNSEIELKSANTAIENMFKAGITPEEASAIFQGFKIRNVDDIQLGSNLLAVGRSLGDKREGIIADISGNINTGNYAMAITTLEEARESTLGEGVSKVADVASDIAILNLIKDKIEEVGGVGPIEGKWELVKGKFREEDMSVLKAYMGSYSVDKINEAFGTAVTAGEDGKTEDITISIDDKIKSVYGKIDAFKQIGITKLNAGRIGKLPELNEEEILNPNKRVEAYRRKNLINGSTQKTDEYDSYINSVYGTQEDEIDNFIKTLNIR